MRTTITNSTFHSNPNPNPTADYGTNQSTWTNTDLASFLAAMSAWSEDMEGFYENSGEDLASLPPWRVLADILMAARVYE